MLLDVDLTGFDADMVAALEAFDCAVAADGSEAAYESAVNAFYAFADDHHQLYEAEMALGL